MSRTALLVALLACPGAAPAWAQAPASVDAPPLTLAAAIAEALERHPAMHAVRAQHDAARAAPAQQRFLTAPMLETQIWSWPVTTLNPARTEMYMFMAEQEIPGTGKRAARALVAERDADLAREQIAVQAVDLLGEVRRAYVDVGLARQLLALYEGQRPLLQDMAEAATLRYVAGEGGQHHSVAALVELTRLERDRIAADERLRGAETRLNAAIGRPLEQPVPALAPIVPSLGIAEAEQVALSRHPDLAIVDAMVTREDAELARLQGERRPDFVVGGGYMLMPGDAGAVTVRGGMTWPNAPWSRARLTAAIDAQNRRVSAVKAQREVVVLRVRRDVREAAIAVTAARRQAQLLQSSVLPQVGHAFDLARVAYIGGAGDFTDLLESRRLLLATRVELAEAEANVSRAVIDLETVAGIQQ